MAPASGKRREVSGKDPPPARLDPPRLLPRLLQDFDPEGGLRPAERRRIHPPRPAPEPHDPALPRERLGAGGLPGEKADFGRGAFAHEDFGALGLRAPRDCGTGRDRAPRNAHARDRASEHHRSQARDRPYSPPDRPRAHARPARSQTKRDTRRHRPSSCRGGGPRPGLRRSGTHLCGRPRRRSGRGPRARRKPDRGGCGMPAPSGPRPAGDAWGCRRKACRSALWPQPRGREPRRGRDRRRRDLPLSPHSVRAGVRPEDPVRAAPAYAQSLASGHSPHRGFRAAQIVRPCRMRQRCSSIPLPGGTSGRRMRNARSGLAASGTRPRRRRIRATCVSTAQRSAPHANMSVTAAVFTPTPFTLERSSIAASTSRSGLRRSASESFPRVSRRCRRNPWIASAFWRARPESRIARSTSERGASRTRAQVGNRRRSSRYARSASASVVAWARMVPTRHEIGSSSRHRGAGPSAARSARRTSRTKLRAERNSRRTGRPSSRFGVRSRPPFSARIRIDILRGARTCGRGRSPHRAVATPGSRRESRLPGPATVRSALDSVLCFARAQAVRAPADRARRRDPASSALFFLTGVSPGGSMARRKEAPRWNRRRNSRREKSGPTQD